MTYSTTNTRKAVDQRRHSREVTAPGGQTSGTQEGTMCHIGPPKMNSQTTKRLFYPHKIGISHESKTPIPCFQFHLELFR